jgi:SAM-dependent methyltransferase
VGAAADRWRAKAIAGRFPGDAQVGYHAPRYAFLLDQLARYVEDPEVRVLDVGRSALTDLIAERFRLPVDSLGFAPDGPTPTGRHYQFDLNQSQDQASWRRDLPVYDVVVLAEVIEHLYTSPSRVLAFLGSLIKPGGRLVVQTPNAAVLGKRIRLLLGRNPYEPIREDRARPGHFREYTDGELRGYLAAAHFAVEACYFRGYFDLRYQDRLTPGRPRGRQWPWRLRTWIYRILPPRLRPGITLIARRPS